MKSWFVSSLLFWVLGGSASAAELSRGFECIQATDLACARSVVDEHRKAGDKAPELDLLEARVLFREGQFEAASRSLKAAASKADKLDLDLIGKPLLDGVAEVDPRKARASREVLKEALNEEVAFYITSAEISATMVESRVGDITVVHDPGIERILVEETAEILTLARKRIVPMLGKDMPFGLRVEMYPDADSFARASGMPMEAIRTTGVVAISKWNRLLVTSPRVRPDGYGWKDTVVHEWVHEVVAYNTDDHAPIWLQEGIAKSMDSLWRADTYEIPVQYQSLLNGALQSGQFITFEQMHPSVAYLPTADMAALAYAQVSTMMDLLRRTRGEDALIRVLAMVKAGKDARDAVAEVANGGDFDKFEAEWKNYLAGLKLVGVKIASTPANVEGGTAMEGDPILARRKDLQNLARLGELMAARGHHDTALAYYQEAMPEDGPPGPYLVVRQAESLAALGRPDDAIAALEANLVFYPEVSANQKLLGELYLARGEDARALRAYAAAADVDPFDVEVQQRLAELYAAAKQPQQAAKHQRYVDVLFYREQG